MSKMIWGIVAAAMLAAPAAANATHIAGATYTGTVSTGQGGNVTVEVSVDGTTADASFTGLGNVAGTCTGVGFSTGDVPIVNHAFSYSANLGQVTAQGSFGAPGDVGGSAQVLNTPCTTGSQAWTAFATTPGPDAMIARSDQPLYAGDDVFNTTAEDQTKSWSARRGQTRRFKIRVENAGNNAQSSFSVTGCRTSKGFKVRYLSEGENITGQVLGSEGYGTATLDVGEFEEILLMIRVTRAAKPGKTKACRVRAEYGPADLADVVKAELKARRG